MKTIALIAESGGGKGLFADIMKKLLPDCRIVSIRFSDALADILGILGKEKSRDNIDMLATALREAFHDEGILNGALKKRLKGINADVVILDGVRKEKEIPFVKECGAVVVYIAADQKVRYERRRHASEKPDELGMSWEQFVTQGDAPPQREIRYIGETMADVMIPNNGTVEEFTLRIKELIKRYGLTDK